MAENASETVEILTGYMDFLNKDAFLISWGFFIAAAAFTNIIVISAIIYLYTCAEDSWLARRTPRFLSMLIGCLAQFVYLVGPSVVGLHRYRFEETKLRSTWTCGKVVAMVVAIDFFASFSILCVAVTVTTEVMRVQAWATLTRKAKMTLTWILLLVSLLYSLVVVMAVFYGVFLSDSHNPCVKFRGVHFINPSPKRENQRAPYIVAFLVPFAVTLLAVVALLFAYPTRRTPEHSARRGPSASGANPGHGSAGSVAPPPTQDCNDCTIVSLSAHSALTSTPPPLSGAPPTELSSDQSVSRHGAVPAASAQQTHGSDLNGVSVQITSLPTATTSNHSEHAERKDLRTYVNQSVSTTMTSPGHAHHNSKSHVLAQEALGYSEETPAVFVSRQTSYDHSSWPPVGGRTVSEIMEEEEVEDRRVSRPCLTVLAGFVVIIFNLFFYVRFEMVSTSDAPRSRMARDAKLWASAVLLQDLGMMLVSVCWLLDHQIRPLIPRYFRNVDLANFRPSAP